MGRMRSDFSSKHPENRRPPCFGTPAEIRAQARERTQVFGRGGGFVYNPIHNVQAQAPVENLLALYETVQIFRAAC
jgi:uroporphyrinogen-III decarboxylase